MYRLNILSQNIFLEDVKSSQIGGVLGWYNNPEYYYATGNKNLITINELWMKYQEYLENPDIFFSIIYRNYDCEPLGFIKGSILKERRNAVWIDILLILSPYQRLGYGSETFYAFFSKFDKKSNIKTVYLSCSEGNIRGMGFWHKMGFCPTKKIRINQYEKTDLRDIIIMEQEFRFNKF